jgi:ubiquitin-conjugating enzyme E2 variant
MGVERTRPAEVSEFPVLPSEVIFVLVGVALVVGNLVRFSGAPEFWDWTTLLLILLGLAGADFVSGVVHWAGDTWGTERTPVVGWRFVRPFRFHHAHPRDMLKSNFFTTNGDNVLGAMPMLLLPFALPVDSIWWMRVAVVVWAAGLFGMWTSQFHLWAHMKRPPRAVRALQRCRLILSQRHHMRHHKSPFRVNYCITTGWCNPLLSRIRFFPAMEWVVSKLTGMTPRPDEQQEVDAGPAVGAQSPQ